MRQNIFDFISEQEGQFKLPVNIFGWEWSMAEHIKTTFFYKHGRLTTGNTDDKPVKNIMKPMLNLQYRTEDIDVKDVELFVEDKKLFPMSFLIKKYHDDIFTQENDIDEFLDDTNTRRIDYGGVLLEDLGEPKPLVIDWKKIAFCDQTNILAGVIGLKHYYSPSEMKEMEKYGWGDTENGADVTIDDLIVLADEKKVDDDGRETKTPGKYVEVYEIHGDMPESFLKDEGDENKYIYQTQIVAFYKNEKNDREGVTLFKSKSKNRFKYNPRDKVNGRALGFGGAEELFESQVWTNYNSIRMKEMLDSAAKTILATDDEELAQRHPSGLKDLDNLELIELGDNKTVKQLDTYPRNLAVFEKATQEWEIHAQKMAAANDSIMGESPNSGTPFKLQELVTQESKGLHNYRKGKFAKFIEEVYRDWILPYIVKEITKDQKFLSQLSFEEMENIAEIMGENIYNDVKIEQVLNGEPINEMEAEQARQQFRETFMRNDKKFIEIVKDELKGASIKIKINIVGKQHDLALQTDKLVNIFRQIATAPQLLDDPRMAKLFNQILESSGLDPIAFGAFKPQQQINQVNNASTAPLKQLAETAQQNNEGNIK